MKKHKIKLKILKIKMIKYQIKPKIMSMIKKSLIHDILKNNNF